MAKDSDYLWLWERIQETDPNFVKQITGKQYRGNSPHPTWLIKNLTKAIGPCGDAFGWEVLDSRYLEGTPHVLKTGEGTSTVIREQMHELRIRFWWRRPGGETVNSFESYGSTRSFYMTSKGTWQHDEDAAKKSLTDAITKAISYIGGAADIFLGRWDDNKYVTELKKQYGVNGAGSSAEPITPQGAF